MRAGAEGGHDLKRAFRHTLQSLRPKHGHWVIFDHCMPFDVRRFFDEAVAPGDRRNGTTHRIIPMQQALEG